MDLRDAIQRIAVEMPSYGRRRITAELRRRGWRVNPKRVYRLMREDNLLCVRRRKFVVTTDSNHSRRVYPNLARKMVLTGMDQLWRADITYVRLREEFVFLAVILDAYSRRVIGWALDRTLEMNSRWLLCAWRCRDAWSKRAWFITPIAARSMPATRNCSKPIASRSACRARGILGTTRLANRS